MMRLFLIIIAVLSLGCTDPAKQLQIRTADAVAVGANDALPALVSSYKSQGDAVIANATSREAAEAGIAKVKEDWAPVWQAWDTLAAAHGVYATALESDGDIGAALEGMRVAWCGLRAVWPEHIPAIPLLPIKCEDRK